MPRKERENGYRILIVEDNESLRLFLTELFSEDFIVSSSQNGREALEQIPLFRPQLILTDIMMPELDGFAFLEALASSPDTVNIPVVIVTGKADRESQSKGLRLGATDYITKPFDIVHIRYKLRNILAKQPPPSDSYIPPSKTGYRPCELPFEEDLFSKRLEKSISTHYSNDDFSVSDLADVMAMSERNLQRKVRDVFSMSPTAFIKRYRLTVAKRLLIQGHSTHEVCYSVGFSSVGHFNRSFKQEFGFSPKDLTKIHVL